ncbi:hypothetical protein P9112_000543 [Eukaryota sp. TZLM1-RC]
MNYLNIVYVTVPAFVFLIILLIFRGLLRSRRVADVISLIGPVDSGKTALFYHYKTGDLIKTHTSMVQNEATFDTNTFIPKLTRKHRKSIALLDFPGHERLRGALSTVLRRSIAIVFMIDGPNIEQTKSQTGRLLYEVLSNDDVVKRRIPVLIAVNKNDVIGGDNVDYVRSILETEITTHINAAASLPGASKVAGKSKGEFSFSQHASPIVFGSISVKKHKLDDVSMFIGSCSKK